MPPMRLTLAELLDRYSIELRKSYYGHGNPDLVHDVYLEIRGQFSNICKGDDSITRAVVNAVLAATELGIVNADIANSEWQVRAGQQLSLEELGRRAVLTRKLNDHRSEIKQNLSAVLQQNVETRHFGYGDDLKTSDLTLDVQEPGP